MLTDEIAFDESETAEKKTVLIKGHLSHSVDYDRWILFTMEFKFISERQIGFKVTLQDTNQNYKIFLSLKSSSDESFFGLGEQFSHFNLKGHAFPVMVREDGVGRGLQPVSGTRTRTKQQPKLTDIE